MRSFFKIFFASLLAIVAFSLIVFFVMAGVIGGLASKDGKDVKDKSVLHIKLSDHFYERANPMPFASLGEGDIPTLYDAVRLIDHAKTDDNIKGIYISMDGHNNGFAASNELRQALERFKTSKKFILAYGTNVTEEGYFIGSVADRVYVNPVGNFEWSGFNVTLPFLKGTLEKLDIETQIFYAGKFKSATEIFRTTEMTPENRLQTLEWLGDIYQYFLMQTAAARGIDTAMLHQYAANATIETPADAVNARLVDAVKHDDEVKDELKKRLGINRTDALHLVKLPDYEEAINIRKSGKDKIAVIYAEGDIVDGEGDNATIGGEHFRALVRKARLDKNVKAIVLRINSGGGSALASDMIWREIEVAKIQDKKPVVVSMGDVAASGGYYIAANADTIFAHPNTITGSIGVFGIVPNMQGFFKNKLGVTFDGVSTAPYADAGSVLKPLQPKEKELVQRSVERIYQQFKQRVAQGINRDTAYVESIAQGRVWSGADALRIGLVDRLGTLQDAINCAAKMAKLDDYALREYPEEESWLNTILGSGDKEPAAYLRKELGEETYRLMLSVKRVKSMVGTVQARLPFDIIYN